MLPQRATIFYAPNATSRVAKIACVVMWSRQDGPAYKHFKTALKIFVYKGNLRPAPLKLNLQSIECGFRRPCEVAVFLGVNLCN